MPSKLIQWFVIIFTVGVVGSLLAVSVQHARTAARKMSSSNNLKQIGLAIHNFEGIYKYLPSGCDAEAKHGWMSRIHNFMEASTWYSWTDFNVSWEHALNRDHFKTNIPAYHIPDCEYRFTSEGYGITNYLANPAVLHRNSKVTFSQLHVGLANVWLIGESAGNKTPFGYPYSWRELHWPLSTDSEGLGAWSDGAHFCKVDCSVIFLSNKTDRAIVEQLAEAAPLPAPELWSRPERQFQGAKTKVNNYVDYVGKDDTDRKGGPPYSRVILNKDGSAEFIDFQSGMIDVDVVMAKYLEAKVLRIKFPQTEQELQRICKLNELETLCLQRHYSRDPNAVRGLELDLLLEGLTKLPKLTFLELNADADELPTIQQALPHCEVVLSKGW